MLIPRVASEGFEPPKALPADLQSDPFGRLGNSPFRISLAFQEPMKTQKAVAPKKGVLPKRPGCSGAPTRA